MAEKKQSPEPIFPKETVESFSGDLLLINKVMKISLLLGEELRNWELKWGEERLQWRMERERLLERIAELEAKRERQSSWTKEEAAGAAGETMTKSERLREGIERPFSDQRWEEELENRRRCAKKLVIASMDVAIDKKKVVDMLRLKLGRKFEEGKVDERACGDGITRWHARLESVEEANKVLAEGTAIRRAFKIKVSPETTFIQRQTRLIVEKRADAETSASKEARIKTESPWI